MYKQRGYINLNTSISRNQAVNILLLLGLLIVLPVLFVLISNRQLLTKQAAGTREVDIRLAPSSGTKNKGERFHTELSLHNISTRASVLAVSGAQAVVSYSDQLTVAQAKCENQFAQNPRNISLATINDTNHTVTFFCTIPVDKTTAPVSLIKNPVGDTYLIFASIDFVPKDTAQAGSNAPVTFVSTRVTEASVNGEAVDVSTAGQGATFSIASLTVSTTPGLTLTPTPTPQGYCSDNSKCLDTQQCGPTYPYNRCIDVVCPVITTDCKRFDPIRNHLCPISNLPDGTRCGVNQVGICQNGQCVNITNTISPTTTIRPTVTPTATIRPTLTPTGTIRPTLTPTSTVRPTITPTSTIRQTLTPTGPVVPQQVLVVRMRGTPYQGQYPIVNIYKNGRIINPTPITVTGTYKFYSYSPADLTAQDPIDVEFANDANMPGGEDRNLYVDYISINGSKIQAEDPSKVFYRAFVGTGQPQTAGGAPDVPASILPVISYQDTGAEGGAMVLWWTGQLKFNQGASPRAGHIVVYVRTSDRQPLRGGQVELIQGTETIAIDEVDPFTGYSVFLGVPADIGLDGPTKYLLKVSSPGYVDQEKTVLLAPYKQQQVDFSLEPMVVTPAEPTPTQTPRVCPATKPKGDANCDGVVDGIDYSYWLNSQCRPGPDQICASLEADFNKDGNVDDTDYQIWFNNRETARP